MSLVGSDRQYNDSGQINHASRVENHSSVTSGQDQCDGADGYHCNSLTDLTVPTIDWLKLFFIVIVMILIW